MKQFLLICAGSCIGVWLFWLATEPLRRRDRQRRQESDHGPSTISSSDSGYRDDTDGNGDSGGDSGGGGDGGGGGGGD